MKQGTPQGPSSRGHSFSPDSGRLKGRDSSLKDKSQDWQREILSSNKYYKLMGNGEYDTENFEETQGIDMDVNEEEDVPVLEPNFPLSEGTNMNRIDETNGSHGRTPHRSGKNPTH